MKYRYYSRDLSDGVKGVEKRDNQREFKRQREAIKRLKASWLWAFSAFEIFRTEESAKKPYTARIFRVFECCPYI